MYEAIVNLFVRDEIIANRINEKKLGFKKITLRNSSEKVKFISRQRR